MPRSSVTAVLTAPFVVAGASSGSAQSLAALIANTQNPETVLEERIRLSELVVEALCEEVSERRLQGDFAEVDLRRFDDEIAKLKAEQRKNDEAFQAIADGVRERARWREIMPAQASRELDLAREDRDRIDAPLEARILSIRESDG